MILSDKDIVEAIKNGDVFIDPFPKVLQPASADLHLGNEFLVPNDNMEIDLRKPVDNRFRSVVVKDDDSIVLKPGEFVLAVTKETVGVNGKFCGRMDGKSSLGRLGLFIHITAGFIDPGNKLKLTLEIYNASGRSMILYSGMPVAQVSFHSMSSTVENTYGKLKNNKYYGADRPQVSQFWKNFETNEHQQSDGVRQDNERVGVENNS